MFLLTSLPRSNRGGLIAGILWVIPAAGYLNALPVLIAEEVRLTDESSFYTDSQAERVVTAVGGVGVQRPAALRAAMTTASNTGENGGAYEMSTDANSAAVS